MVISDFSQLLYYFFIDHLSIGSFFKNILAEWEEIHIYLQHIILLNFSKLQKLLGCFNSSA